MSEENDINAIANVVRFLSALGGAYLKANEDGSVNIQDVFQLTSVIPTLWPVLNTLSEVPTELEDLSDEELDELYTIIKQTIDVDDAEKEVAYEAIAISAINFINELYGVIVAIQAAKGIIDIEDFISIVDPDDTEDEDLQ